MDAHSTILLLQELSGQRIVVDLKETQGPPYPDVHIPTDHVHYKYFPQEVVTDPLENFSVVETDPPSMQLRVTSGILQNFDEVLQVKDSITTPAFLKVTGLDSRSDVLCLRKDRVSDIVTAVIISGVAGSDTLPLLPFDCFPIAIVTVNSGDAQLDSNNIFMLRTLHRYSPSGKYRLPPVQTVEELAGVEAPVLGMDVLVVTEGCYYFWDGGVWRKAIGARFDNTVFTMDCSETITYLQLPWPIASKPEIVVFRDGLLLTPDLDYSVSLGLAPVIVFNYAVEKDQRITVIRNPFLGAAYDPASSDNAFDVWDIYVDGVSGRDYQSGTSYDDAFKTLQRAFDVIPTYSKDMYRIHARNLRLSDSFIDTGFNKRTYGVLKSRLAAVIVVDIESAQVDTTIPYVFYAVDTRTILISNQTLLYPVSFVRCSVSLIDSTLNEDMYFASSVVFATNTEFKKTVALFAGTTAYFNTVQAATCNVHSGGYLDGTVLTLGNILCASGGHYKLDLSYIAGANVTGGSLTFDNCQFMGTGGYSHCYILVSSCSNVGAATLSVTPHFILLGGAYIRAVNSTFRYLLGNGLTASHNCVVSIENCNICDVTGHGVSCTYSSTLKITGTSISYCSLSALYLNFGSMAAITYTTGAYNLRYGVEAYNFSYLEKENSTVTGNLGDMYYTNPGADTCAVSPTDRFPATLSEKLVAGSNVSLEVYEVVSNNQRMRVSLDYKSTSINPAAMVYTLGNSLSPGDVWSVLNKSPNPGIIAQVLAFNPYTSQETRMTSLTSANADLFTQMDKNYGTEFTGTDLRLKYRVGLGYPNDTPYWVYSDKDGAAALPTHSLTALDAFNIVYTMPTGTYIRVAFSFDSANTFRRWNPATESWQSLGGGTVLGQLYLADGINEVNLYSQAAWNALLVAANGNPIQVGILLGTPDQQITPSISSWQWTFTQSGYRYPVNSADLEIKIFSTRIEIKNIGTAVLQPPIHAVFLPLVHSM